MKSQRSKHLEKFGFSSGIGGAHIARTMMLDELAALLSYVPATDASKEEYSHAINEENCLGKRSGRSRQISYRHLANLYGLDSSLVLFRALRYLWDRDETAHPQIALLSAYVRDAVLRSTAPFILELPEGTTISREATEEFIESLMPERFSKATLKSTAQNVNGTWTKAGHLVGRTKKRRIPIEATAGSVSYALLLGYLTGIRGPSLFKALYIKLLDCSFEKAIERAEEASRRGWIVFKRVGDVMEVQFPNLMTDQEMEWLREQG